jgi:hypothetical protein
MNSRTFSAIIRCGVAAACLLQPVYARNVHKLAPDLIAGTGAQDVIVQFVHEPTDATRARVTAKGGQLKQNLRGSRSGVYTLTASAIEALSDDPEIRYISPDRRVKRYLEFARPAVGGDIAHS